MKQVKYLLFVPLSLVLFILSCNKNNSTDDPTTSSGNWVKRAECDGNARAYAVSFVIGDTAYIATGIDGSNVRYQDVWAYDQNKNYWIQKAQFLGSARNSATAFAVGTKGYIIGGYDGVNRLQDNWQYDQATNKWLQKANLPDVLNAPVGSGARYNATGFAIGNFGYVFGGFNGGYTKDFWQYNPATDTWNNSVFPSYGGSKRSGASVFVYSNKAYIVGGLNNGVAQNDFWVFDPSVPAAPWTQLRNVSNTSSDTYDDDYSDIIRYNAVALVMNNGTTPKGYLICGQNGGYTKKTWEYDFASDLWTRKTTYERAEREGAVAFTVKGRGFVGLGKNSSYFLDDLDEWKPADTYDSND